MISYIYKLTNKVNKGVYIGQTNDVERRFQEHKTDAKNGSMKSIHIAMREFGEENFVLEVIDETFKRHARIVEDWYIKKNLNKYYVCYNTDYHGEEYKQKISLVTRGSNNGMYGRKGEKATNGKSLLALDIEGNVIHRFNTVQLALAFLNLKGHSGLNKAIDKNIEYKGFYWKREKSLLEKGVTTIETTSA